MVFDGCKKHSDEFRSDLLGHADVFFSFHAANMSKYNIQSLQVAMNELSNHDHSRFLTRTNRKVGRTSTAGPQAAESNINKGIMRIAVLIQMTWPGAPTVYYGDEAGVCGWTDPDNRRTYPWGREDKELIRLHKELIHMHKAFDALKTGSIIFLDGANKFISYGRFDEKDKFVVAVNCGSAEKTVEINVWEIGIVDGERIVQLIMTREHDFDLSAKVYYSENGILKLNMPPISSILLKTVDII